MAEAQLAVYKDTVSPGDYKPGNPFLEVFVQPGNSQLCGPTPANVTVVSHPADGYYEEGYNITLPNCATTLRT